MILEPYELRHKIHQNPELSLKEYETTKLLENNISEISKKYDVDLKINKPLETGLIVEYNGNNLSKDFLLFRADIDALNIKEETNVEFASKNDYMHACGHDVHTAILYGVLLNVVKNKVKENIIFLFQPAEESKGGAERILKSKVLDKYNIKSAFALHVTDEYSLGSIATTRGTLFASSLEIFIDFEGVSAHLAFPHKSKNALNALRTFLDSIDKIPRNPMDPFVIGIGKVMAGNAINILPSHAHLEGSIRSDNSNKVIEFFQKIEDVLQGIKTITEVNYLLNKGSFYPEVINNGELFDKYIPKISSKFNFIDCGLKMTAEDFGFISKQYPSLMCWLGTSKGEYYGIHNPKFLPSDEVIDLGIELFETFMS